MGLTMALRSKQIKHHCLLPSLAETEGFEPSLVLSRTLISNQVHSLILPCPLNVYHNLDLNCSIVKVRSFWLTKSRNSSLPLLNFSYLHTPKTSFWNSTGLVFSQL